MYSVILMAALTSSADVPDFHRRGGCGGEGQRAGLFQRFRDRRGGCGGGQAGYGYSYGCGGGQASYGCGGGQAAYGWGESYYAPNGGRATYYRPAQAAPAAPAIAPATVPAEPMPPPAAPPKEKTSARPLRYIQVCENGVCRMVLVAN